MKLYNVIIGDQTLVSNNWVKITDEYDNMFIANVSIRQRIRVGKKVAVGEDIFEKLSSASNMAVYKLPDNTLLSNSNTTMNLTLMNESKKQKKKEPMDVVYVTLNNKNYVLLWYDDNGNNIIQTYRSNTNFQGAVVELTNTNDETRNVINLYTYNVYTYRYENITVSVNGDSVKVTKEDLKGDDLKKARNIYRDNKSKTKKLVHFKIKLAPNIIPSSTFIVDSTNNELVEIAKKIAEDNKNINILMVPGNDIFTNGTDDEKAAVSKMFEECLLSKNIRCVVTFGITLSREFYKNYKVLYAFAYTNSGFKCIRSN